MRRLLEALEQLKGAEAVEQTLALLPSEFAQDLRYGGVSSTAWYPLEWHAALHEAARNATGSGPELPRQIGYQGARTNFTTVHKVFLALMTPESVLERAQRIFNQYYERGELAVPEMRKGFAHVVLKDCRAFSHNIYEAIAGNVVAVLELCKASNVRVRITEGGADGAEHAVYTIYWT